MGPLASLLVAYLLGGITFIPLVILAIFVHAHYTFPHRHDDAQSTEYSKAKQTISNDEDDIIQDGDDIVPLDTVKKASPQELAAAFKNTNQDIGDVAAGFFAVCREYTPMGINAKPIERSTPVGSTTVASPSPSVYQTMYRSIFDRKAAPAGPMESNSMSQRPKRAGNVFYIVLRYVF